MVGLLYHTKHTQYVCTVQDVWWFSLTVSLMGSAVSQKAQCEAYQREDPPSEWPAASSNGWFRQRTGGSVSPAFASCSIGLFLMFLLFPADLRLLFLWPSHVDWTSQTSQESSKPSTPGRESWGIRFHEWSSYSALSLFNKQIAAAELYKPVGSVSLKNPAQ